MLSHCSIQIVSIQWHAYADRGMQTQTDGTNCTIHAASAIAVTRHAVVPCILHCTKLPPGSSQKSCQYYECLLVKSCMCAAGVQSVWLELRNCHCLRNEMSHFCTDLQTYIMFEVLETAWDIFMAQLQVVEPQILVTHCQVCGASCSVSSCIVSLVVHP